MTSELIVTWYFDRAIQMTIFEGKLQTLSACKIVSFKARRFKLWNPVFRMVNIITKQKQFSLHGHFKPPKFRKARYIA